MPPSAVKKKKRNRSIVLIQRPCVWAVLLSWRAIRDADRIVVLPRWNLFGGPPESQGGLSPAVLWWIRRFNRKACRVGLLPREAYLRLWHEDNEASDDLLSAWIGSVLSQRSPRAMQKELGSDLVERYYRIRLLPDLQNRSRFYRCAQRLSQEGEIWLLPERWDRDGVARLLQAPGIERIPKGLARTLRWRDRLSVCLRAGFGLNWIRSMVWTLEPLLKAGINLRGGRLKPAIPAVEILLPLSQGLRTAEESDRPGQDDGCWIGPPLSPEQIGFLPSRRFPAGWLRQQKERIQSRGARYLDPSHLPVDPALFQELLSLSVIFWKGLIHPAVLLERPETTAASAALAREFLSQWRILRSIQFKVRWEDRDYDALHIVRTLVTRRLGRLTVGMHHENPVLTRVVPGNRYLELDRLCVWSRTFAQRQAPHWDRLPQIPVGTWRSDAIHRARQEPRYSRLQTLAHSCLGPVRPRILLLLPSLDWYVLPQRVQALLEGLRLLRKNPGDFRIICRFRSSELKRRWLVLGLGEILQTDSRIQEGDRPLTTYEWMALSDLVIAGSHSSGLIEAASAGIPCAAFDHMNTAQWLMGRYAPDRVIRSAADFVRVVEAAGDGGPMPSGLQKMAEDFSEYADGRCSERIRQVLWETARLACFKQEAAIPAWA